MKILYLTFYFEPDLCAGSFRNSSLAKQVSRKLSPYDEIHVVTTMPNRYKSFKEKAESREQRGNVLIERIQLPEHDSGFLDQINSFKTYFLHALKLTKGREYDLVFASSSRLFTAFLGRCLSKHFKAPLYLDIRDIFTDTMREVIGNKLLKAVLLPFLLAIEKYTFSKANHINLVSGGFKGYFERYNQPSYSFFTNGIDDEFLDLPKTGERQEGPLIITYAGNIGEGQGLHKVIPQAAKALGSGYKFKVIGDGGAKTKLVEAIKEMGVENVDVLKPVSRPVLQEHYLASDYLFLHLNDFQAFEKVLPSKIFEYGAYDKPVIAGVGGFANQFIRENLTNHVLFNPGNVDSFASQMKAHQLINERRSDFISKFSRSGIMEKMAADIVEKVGTPKSVSA